MRASRQHFLRLAVMSAALAAPGLALACDFYRTADSRLSIYDRPDAGAGLAVAILPQGSEACIVESRTDHAGNGWDRIDFYMLDNVRYSASGWLPGGAGGATSEEAPGEAAVTGTDVAAAAAPAAAETTGSREAFFASSWALAPEKSSLHFVSVKKGTVAEVHSFNGLSGTIQPDGTAQVTIDLETVETGVDIRNVRMRFLLFAIDQTPEATITASIDPAAVSQVWDEMRVNADIPFMVNLHGVEKEVTIPVIISRLGQNMVSVASREPVLIEASDFALDGGIAQLSEAVGNIGIATTVPVTFDLAFAVSEGN